MKEKSKELARRRDELIAKSARQREQLSSAVADIWNPSALFGKSLFNQSRKWPMAASFISSIGTLFLRNRRLVSYLAALAMLFRVWKRLAPYIMPVVQAVKRFNKKRTKKA